MKNIDGTGKGLHIFSQKSSISSLSMNVIKFQFDHFIFVGNICVDLFFFLKRYCTRDVYNILSNKILGSKPDFEEDKCTNITSEWESDTSKERCPQEDWTVQAVAAFYLLFSNLLLVNLVIAMFR